MALHTALTRQATAPGAEGWLRCQLDDVIEQVAHQPLSVLLRRILRVTKQAVPCARATVHIHDDPAGPISEPQSAVGEPDDLTPPGPFVSVPIVLRGRQAGELALTDLSKPDALTPAVLLAIETVAAAATTVIERSRTLRANREREAWSISATETAKAIVAGISGDRRQLIVDRVAQLAPRSTAAILRQGTGEDSLVVVAATGSRWDAWKGHDIVIPDSTCTRVLATGRAVSLGHITEFPLPAGAGRDPDIGPVAVIPMVGSGVNYGVLLIGREPGDLPLSAAEIGMATLFAATVTLALELADTQPQRDELVLVEERDRLARDLHDHVIQRLYAIGLGLERTAATADQSTRIELGKRIDDIDDTIHKIRSTIFQLRPPLLSPRQSLRARAEAILSELTPVLGFRPRLVSDGPVDFGVRETLLDDCEAVLREAVTNIGRHAQATEAEVALCLSASQLRIEVRDNGRGITNSTRSSGLSNLAARAKMHGGFMQVRTSATDGTWIQWCVDSTG